MARRITRRDNPELDEGPTSEDVERFSGVTQNCPNCGTELYDDAEICWKCGMAIMGGDRRSGMTWIIVVVVVLIVALAVWQIF